MEHSMPDRSGLRRVFNLRNGVGAVFACGIGLIASSPIAEDTSELRQLADNRLNLLKSTAADTPVPGGGDDGVVVNSPQQPRSTFNDLDAAASGLNDALDGARSKLDQLREATEIAAIAASLRDELEASAEENNRLAAALTQAEATRRSLEASIDKSDDQITSLTAALQEERSKANGLNQELRSSREKTEATDVSRIAALQRADRAESQLADSRDQNQALLQENNILKGKLKATRSERDKARTATELTRQERDAANQELDQIRLRIAGLLRSVLHANEPVNPPLGQKGAALASPADVATAQNSEPVTYKIIQTSNIRAEPHREAARVDIGIAGEEISIVRKVPNVDWFEIKTKRGVNGFIFGELVQPAPR